RPVRASAPLGGIGDAFADRAQSFKDHARKCRLFPRIRNAIISDFEGISKSAAKTSKYALRNTRVFLSLIR
ncbi:MAG: hypothetical protein AAB578_09695, partial [Elusimicrobiota bacterium]